jgi:hypothetical protein
MDEEKSNFNMWNLCQAKTSFDKVFHILDEYVILDKLISLGHTSFMYKVVMYPFIQEVIISSSICWRYMSE